MINKNNKKLKGLIRNASILGLVAAISIGATLALLSATTEERVNTFKAGGDIDIDLEEPNWEVDGEASHFAPGSVIPKDPTVSVPDTSKLDEYVAVTVDYYIDKDGNGEYDESEMVKYSEFTDYADIKFDDTMKYNENDWAVADEYNKFYYGSSADASGLNVFLKGTEAVVFKEVVVNKEIPKYETNTDMYKKGTPVAFKIDVKAYGVQESIGADKAIIALDKMIAGEDPNSVI